MAGIPRAHRASNIKTLVPPPPNSISMGECAEAFVEVRRRIRELQGRHPDAVKPTDRSELAFLRKWVESFEKTVEDSR